MEKGTEVEWQYAIPFLCLGGDDYGNRVAHSIIPMVEKQHKFSRRDQCDLDY